jgi:short subunit fatty acids transporter
VAKHLLSILTLYLLGIQLKAGSASNTVVLPLLVAGTYSGTIDWGDGNSTSALSYANRTHVYATGGIKTITITGTILMDGNSTIAVIDKR